jgi:hypothetical protein
MTHWNIHGLDFIIIIFIIAIIVIIHLLTLWITYISTRIGCGCLEIP